MCEPKSSGRWTRYIRIMIRQLQGGIMTFIMDVKETYSVQNKKWLHTQDAQNV